jgi:NAD(P)-dependent dehydrogenase (short-subunit alcohol dehydrogenase family)
MALLKDKVCVITGGAGSIGTATAALFLEEGAKVLLVDLREPDLAAAAGRLGSERVATIAADVSRAADVQAYVAKAISHFGKIDVLVSNAGNAGPIGPLADYPEDQFDAVYAVHVRGAFLAAKYGMAEMNDGASMIITSSVAAFRSDPGPLAYITAKHAQIALMRCLAKEGAPRRIRVNSIHPGPVDNAFQLAIEDNLSAVIHQNATALFNEIIPLQRHASPREIARSMLYLASEQSSFTTGTMLRVDGGMGL